jgi:hypothetical protein
MAALLVTEPLWWFTHSHHQGSRPDALRGTVYRAGTYIHASEGFAVTSINRDGWRGPEFTEPARGELRVLAVGDSYTEALQVADGLTFCDQLANLLERWTSRPVRVLNCGVSGGNPAEYVHLAHHLSRQYQPGWTVVQVTDSDFFPEELFNDDRRVRLVVNAQGFETKARVTNSLWATASTRWPQLGYATGLGTWRVAAKAYKALQHSAAAKPTPPTRTAGLTPEVRAALPWLLRRLKAEYPHPVLLYLPTNGYSAIERPLEEAATQTGLPLLNMRNDFEAFEATSRQRTCGFSNSIPGQGHLNAWGHARVAERLAHHLKSVATQ